MLFTLSNMSSENIFSILSFS